METYADGWLSGVSGGISGTTSSGLDWLNAGLDSLGSTAIKVLDVKAKIDSVKAQSDTQAQYQTAVQTPVGSKNLVSGIDNNILLVAGVGALAFFMLAKG